MALAAFTHDFQDEQGNLLTGPVTVTVIPEIGTARPQPFEDYAGDVPLGNPFVNNGGRVAFHMAGGFYRVQVSAAGMEPRTLRYVAIGLAGGTDFVLARNAGVYSGVTSYAHGDYVVHGGKGIFISTQDGNLNHTPDSVTPGSTTYWTYYPGLVGPPGAGMMVAVSDEATEISAGTSRLTFRAPNALTLTTVKASLNVASSSGAVQVDINVNGSSILSTELTIDQGEKTSVTAAVPAVLSAPNVADDDEITIDIDSPGVGAKGLKVTFVGAA